MKASQFAGYSNLDAGFRLQGDPTYLSVKEDLSIASFGINAVCTHLGCVVPWNQAENKFMCPCHGSQYNPEGKVVRGPAPLVSSELFGFAGIVPRNAVVPAEHLFWADSECTSCI
jgi:hypothetical protein